MRSTPQKRKSLFGPPGERQFLLMQSGAAAGFQFQQRPFVVVGSVYGLCFSPTDDQHHPRQGYSPTPTGSPSSSAMAWGKSSSRCAGSSAAQQLSLSPAASAPPSSGLASGSPSLSLSTHSLAITPSPPRRTCRSTPPSSTPTYSRRSRTCLGPSLPRKGPPSVFISQHSKGIRTRPGRLPPLVLPRARHDHRVLRLAAPASTPASDTNTNGVF